MISIEPKSFDDTNLSCFCHSTLGTCYAGKSLDINRDKSGIVFIIKNIRSHNALNSVVSCGQKECEIHAVPSIRIGFILFIICFSCSSSIQHNNNNNNNNSYSSNFKRIKSNLNDMGKCDFLPSVSIYFVSHHLQ